MIIKAHQVQFSKLWILFSFIFFFNCQKQTDKKEQISNVVSQNNSITISKSALVLNPNIGLVLYKDKPFTGFSVLKYPNGNTAETIQYKNGIKDGIFKKWFKNGLLSYDAFYAKGKLNGVSKSWWSNGNLRSESKHTDGIASGIQKQWYNSGELFKQLTIVNGKEEGLQKAWRRNGKIYNNYEAKNGRIFGLKRANLCFQLEEEIVQDKKL